MFNHAFTLMLGCKHSPILGVPSIYADTLWCRTTKFGMVTYGRGLFLSGQPHPHLKGAGSHCSPILGVPFYLCTLYHGTTKFDMVTHMGKGRGMFLNGQLRPHPKGSGLCARKFLKFPLIFAYTLCRRTAKFDVVTHVGRCMYLGVSHASYPKRAEFQWSPIFGVLLDLCLYPLTQHAQIRHGNT